MQAYIFNADIYCEDCGRRLVEEYTADEIEDNGDSDTFPQGPYPDGGGEADCPQHCSNCRCFLENPLTTDGAEYVLEALNQHAESGRDDSGVLREWSEFYGIRPRRTYWTVRDAGRLLLAIRDTQESANRAADDIEREHDRECSVQAERLDESDVTLDVYSEN